MESSNDWYKDYVIEVNIPSVRINMDTCAFCGAQSLEPTVCSCDKNFEVFDDAVEFEIPIRLTPKEASAATWGKENA